MQYDLAEPLIQSSGTIIHPDKASPPRVVEDIEFVTPELDDAKIAAVKKALWASGFVGCRGTAWHWKDDVHSRNSGPGTSE